jgi:hypothetical protein
MATSLGMEGGCRSFFRRAGPCGTHQVAGNARARVGAGHTLKHLAWLTPGVPAGPPAGTVLDLGIRSLILTE